MTEKEFEDYLQRVNQEVMSRQKVLTQNYNLHGYTKYVFHKNDHILELKDELDKSLKFDIVCIGSWNKKDKSWVWAWANDNLPETLRQKAKCIKVLGKKTGYEVFEKEGFDCEELVARDLAFLGVHELEAQGIYRIEAEDNYVFVAIMDIIE